MSHSHSRPSSSASHNSRIPVRTSYKDNGHDIYHPHKRPGSTDSGTSVGSTNPLGLEHNLGVGRGASIKSGSRPKSLNLGGAGNISFYPAGSLPGSPTRPVLDSPTRTTSGLRISSRQSLASPSPSPSGLLSPGFTKRDYFQNKTYNKRIMSFKKENPEPPGSQLPSVAQAEETHVPGDQDAVSLLKQLVASVTSDDSDDSDEKPFEDEATMEDSIWNRLGELRFGDIWQRYNPNGEQLIYVREFKEIVEGLKKEGLGYSFRSQKDELHQFLEQLDLAYKTLSKAHIIELLKRIPSGTDRDQYEEESDDEETPDALVLSPNTHTPRQTPVSPRLRKKSFSGTNSRGGIYIAAPDSSAPPATPTLLKRIGQAEETPASSVTSTGEYYAVYSSLQAAEKKIAVLEKELKFMANKSMLMGIRKEGSDEHEKVDELMKKLESKEDEVKELTAKVNILLVREKQMEAELDKCRKDLHKAQEANVALDDDTGELKAHIQRLFAKLNEAKGDISAKDEQIAALTADVQKKTNSHSLLEQKYKGLDTKHTELYEAFHLAREEAARVWKKKEREVNECTQKLRLLEDKYNVLYQESKSQARRHGFSDFTRGQSLPKYADFGSMQDAEDDEDSVVEIDVQTELTQPPGDAAYKFTVEGNITFTVQEWCKLREEFPSISSLDTLGTGKLADDWVQIREFEWNEMHKKVLKSAEKDRLVMEEGCTGVHIARKDLECMEKKIEACKEHHQGLREEMSRTSSQQPKPPLLSGGRTGPTFAEALKAPLQSISTVPTINIEKLEAVQDALRFTEDALRDARSQLQDAKMRAVACPRLHIEAAELDNYQRITATCTGRHPTKEELDRLTTPPQPFGTDHKGSSRSARSSKLVDEAEWETTQEWLKNAENKLKACTGFHVEQGELDDLKNLRKRMGECTGRHVNKEEWERLHIPPQISSEASSEGDVQIVPKTQWDETQTWLKSAKYKMSYCSGVHISKEELDNLYERLSRCNGRHVTVEELKSLRTPHFRNESTATIIFTPAGEISEDTVQISKFIWEDTLDKARVCTGFHIPQEGLKNFRWSIKTIPDSDVPDGMVQIPASLWRESKNRLKKCNGIHVSPEELERLQKPKILSEVPAGMVQIPQPFWKETLGKAKMCTGFHIPADGLKALREPLKTAANSTVPEGMVLISDLIWRETSQRAEMCTGIHITEEGLDLFRQQNIPVPGVAGPVEVPESVWTETIKKAAMCTGYHLSADGLEERLVSIISGPGSGMPLGMVQVPEALWEDIAERLRRNVAEPKSKAWSMPAQRKDILNMPPGYIPIPEDAWKNTLDKIEKCTGVHISIEELDSLRKYVPLPAAGLTTIPTSAYRDLKAKADECNGIHMTEEKLRELHANMPRAPSPEIFVGAGDPPKNTQLYSPPDSPQILSKSRSQSLIRRQMLEGPTLVKITASVWDDAMMKIQNCTGFHVDSKEDLVLLDQIKKEKDNLQLLGTGAGKADSKLTYANDMVPPGKMLIDESEYERLNEIKRIPEFCNANHVSTEEIEWLRNPIPTASELPSKDEWERLRQKLSLCEGNVHVGEDEMERMLGIINRCNGRHVSDQEVEELHETIGYCRAHHINREGLEYTTMKEKADNCHGFHVPLDEWRNIEEKINRCNQSFIHISLEDYEAMDHKVQNCEGKVHVPELQYARMVEEMKQKGITPPTVRETPPDFTVDQYKALEEQLRSAEQRLNQCSGMEHVPEVEYRRMNIEIEALRSNDVPSRPALTRQHTEELNQYKAMQAALKPFEGKVALTEKEHKELLTKAARAGMVEVNGRDVSEKEVLGWKDKMDTLQRTVDQTKAMIMMAPELYNQLQRNLRECKENVHVPTARYNQMKKYLAIVTTQSADEQDAPEQPERAECRGMIHVSQEMHDQMLKERKICEEMRHIPVPEYNRIMTGLFASSDPPKDFTPEKIPEPDQCKGMLHVPVEKWELMLKEREQMQKNLDHAQTEIKNTVRGITKQDIEELGGAIDEQTQKLQFLPGLSDPSVQLAPVGSHEPDIEVVEEKVLPLLVGVTPLEGLVWLIKDLARFAVAYSPLSHVHAWRVRKWGERREREAEEALEEEKRRADEGKKSGGEQKGKGTDQNSVSEKDSDSGTVKQKSEDKGKGRQSGPSASGGQPGKDSDSEDSEPEKRDKGKGRQDDEQGESSKRPPPPPSEYFPARSSSRSLEESVLRNTDPGDRRRHSVLLDYLGKFWMSLVYLTFLWASLHFLIARHRLEVERMQWGEANGPFIRGVLSSHRGGCVAGGPSGIGTAGWGMGAGSVGNQCEDVRWEDGKLWRVMRMWVDEKWGVNRSTPA